MKTTTATRTTDIDLINVEANGESEAVASGKLVLAAMDKAARVRIAANDLAEDVWSEMVQYLGRRGVDVRYDHDDGHPVAALRGE